MDRCADDPDVARNVDATGLKLAPQHTRETRVRFIIRLVPEGFAGRSDSLVSYGNSFFG